jgi:hypothetical protein
MSPKLLNNVLAYERNNACLPLHNNVDSPKSLDHGELTEGDQERMW